MLGNFLADYLRNPQVRALPDPVREGVQLHRQIDSFTDNHEEVRAAVRRLQGQHRKYASVVVDIYFDYLLFQHWDHFAEEAFPVFTGRVYRTLWQNTDLMPSPLPQRLAGMIEGDWLRSYGSREGLAYAYSRLQRRMSRPEHLAGVMDSLDEHHAELQVHFLRFFPDLIRRVERFCAC